MKRIEAREKEIKGINNMEVYYHFNSENHFSKLNEKIAHTGKLVKEIEKIVKSKYIEIEFRNKKYRGATVEIQCHLDIGKVVVNVGSDYVLEEMTKEGGCDTYFGSVSILPEDNVIKSHLLILIKALKKIKKTYEQSFDYWNGEEENGR